MKIHLGTVGHFGLAVRGVRACADWWMRSFDLEELFASHDTIGLSNDDVTIVLFEGEPHPSVIDHVSFHCKDMAALRQAVERLREAGVHLEDPGNEIGPEADGSPNMGVWFHDPQGYRWELSVQGGAKEA